VPIGTDASVMVDGVNADHTVFVEVFAHQGNVKGGQFHKVARDALKLITLGKQHTGARLNVAFGDPDANRPLAVCLGWSRLSPQAKAK